MVCMIESNKTKSEKAAVLLYLNTSQKVADLVLKLPVFMGKVRVYWYRYSWNSFRPMGLYSHLFNHS